MSLIDHLNYWYILHKAMLNFIHLCIVQCHVVLLLTLYISQLYRLFICSVNNDVALANSLFVAAM